MSELRSPGRSPSDPLISRSTARWILLWAGLAAGCQAQRPEPPATVAIDFYRASGIGQAELAAWLDQRQPNGRAETLPLVLTLHNRDGDILMENRLIVAWNAGQHRLLISRSGLVEFTLDKSKLPGLTIIAPAGYDVLRQRTIPLGSAYEPEEETDFRQFDFDVTDDGRMASELRTRLQQAKTAGQVIGYQTLRAQLRRRRFPLQLAEPPEQELTPAEIFRLRKQSVVIVGSLDDSGQLAQAAGVIVDGSGVIVTGYHVLDKPPSVGARGVMTADGQFYPLREVLAANPAADVAVLKIDAEGLPAAPLSRGDPEGTPVTVIAHPGLRYFSLTHGYISRYWLQTSHGRTAVMLAITADFADGASGGPAFNPHGAVAGIVSYTTSLSYQMVLKECASALEIRRLFEDPGPVPVSSLNSSSRPRFCGRN